MAEKRERKKKLYTPDTAACVPYMTRVQSSVTPNMYVLGVTLDWTRVAGQGQQEMTERKKAKRQKKMSAMTFKGLAP